MRTATVSTDVYRYSELNDEAKDKAIEGLYNVNIDYEWWDTIYSDAEDAGLKITEFDLDRNRYAKGHFTDSAEETAHKIVDNHGDICETFTTATAYLKARDYLIDNAPKDEDGDFEDEYQLDGELDDLDAEFLKSILEDYSIMLQHESEYLQSREAIEETIEANEYEFTEDGKLY